MLSSLDIKRFFWVHRASPNREFRVGVEGSFKRGVHCSAQDKGWKLVSHLFKVGTLL